MDVITTVDELAQLCTESREHSMAIGFVPTMGYLHEGHKSLIRKSIDQCDVTIVSNFVNPTQFGPHEDLDIYPRDQQGDIAACEDAKVDVVFCPPVEEIYPQDTLIDAPQYSELTSRLCGHFRPGHFEGVLQVMNRFFSIINPDQCFMGRKDAQQLLLVKKLAQDRNPDIEIVGCPTIREHDNVAMSSRNVYLSEEERLNARNIFRQLSSVADAINAGVDISSLLLTATTALIETNLQPQYFDFVSRDSFTHHDVVGVGEYLLCTAVVCGSTRLIDNFFVDVKNDGQVVIDRGVHAEQEGMHVHG